MYRDEFLLMPLRQDAVNGSLSHSVLLISMDDFALNQTAKLLAQTLMCVEADKPCLLCQECKKIEHNNNVDVITFPQKSNVIGKEEIETLMDLVYQAPYASDKKIVILKNVDTIDVRMQNKLLKTLEEPPKNTYFLLLASSDINILQTIKSRCRMVYLKHTNSQTLIEVLQGLNVPEDRQRVILHYAQGNCSLAMKYAQNEQFFEIVNFVNDVMAKFRKSSQMLDYSNKLYKIGDNFEEFLTIFLKNCADAVRYLTQGKQSTNIAKIVANDFSIDALVEIVKQVGICVEKIRGNCNINTLIDEFLLMILEVRHKWPVL